MQQGIPKTCLAVVCRGGVVRFQTLRRGCEMVMPLAFNFWGHAKSLAHERKYWEAKSFRRGLKKLPDWQETEMLHSGPLASGEPWLPGSLLHLRGGHGSCQSPATHCWCFKFITMSLTPCELSVETSRTSVYYKIIRTMEFCIPQIEPTFFFVCLVNPRKSWSCYREVVQILAFINQ